MSKIPWRRRPTVRRWFATRLAVAGLMVGAAFVLMSAPAMADCPVTDPTCLPGTTPDPVTTIADATTEVAAAATGPVDQATTAADPVTQAVEPVTDPVTQGVEPVTDTVKGIVGQTPNPPDPGAIGASASLGSLRSIRFWTATKSRTITASARGKASASAAWIVRDPIRSNSPCCGMAIERAGVEVIGPGTGPMTGPRPRNVGPAPPAPGDSAPPGPAAEPFPLRDHRILRGRLRTQARRGRRPSGWRRRRRAGRRRTAR